MAKKAANNKKKTSPKKATKKVAAKATKSTSKKTAKVKAKAAPAKKVAKKAVKKVAKPVVKKAAAKAVDKKALKAEQAKKAAQAKQAAKEAKLEAAKVAKAQKTEKQKSSAAAGKAKSADKAKGKKGKKADVEDMTLEMQDDVATVEEAIDDFDDEELNKAVPKSGPRSIVEVEEKELPTVKVKALADEVDISEVLNRVRNLEFFIDEGDECIEKNCDSPATTGNYCRFHYIKNWQDVKKREGILKEGKLHQFIEELLRKYGQKQIEGMQADLSDDKNFFSVLKELNIELEDESFEEADDELLDDDTDIAFETKPGKLGFIED